MSDQKEIAASIGVLIERAGKLIDIPGVPHGDKALVLAMLAQVSGTLLVQAQLAEIALIAEKVGTEQHEAPGVARCLCGKREPYRKSLSGADYGLPVGWATVMIATEGATTRTYTLCPTHRDAVNARLTGIADLAFQRPVPIDTAPL